MNKDEIIEWLLGCDDDALFERSAQIRHQTVGDKVYLRGLIELSNICSKDCLYCGIRKSNSEVERYALSKEQIMSAVDLAAELRFGSVVLQSGEQTSPSFVDFIDNILRTISSKYGESLGITISIGEQSEGVYRRWRSAGAHRYLLRMESSSDELYAKIHPAGYILSERLDALKLLKKLGYQVGSGVMIGLPYQTIEDLADDLIAMRKLDIDMCGMGPYIEHSAAPLSKIETAYTPEERVKLTLRMIALLRIEMPTINIAATTATETLDINGRVKSIAAGANVMMPNLTPLDMRQKYCLYNGKTSTNLEIENYNIEYGERGDSLHYKG